MDEQEEGLCDQVEMLIQDAKEMRLHVSEAKARILLVGKSETGNNPEVQISEHDRGCVEGSPMREAS